MTTATVLLALVPASDEEEGSSMPRWLLLELKKRSKKSLIAFITTEIDLLSLVLVGKGDGEVLPGPSCPPPDPRRAPAVRPMVLVVVVVLLLLLQLVSLSLLLRRPERHRRRVRLERAVGEEALPQALDAGGERLQLLLAEPPVVVPGVLVLVAQQLQLQRLHPEQRAVRALQEEGPHVGARLPGVVHAVGLGDLALKRRVALESLRPVSGWEREGEQ